MADIVYVYKEYNDSLAYGEELIQVFRSYSKAEQFFHKRLQKAYGMTLREMQTDPMFKEDCISDNFVAVANDGGDVSYFTIETHPLQ